MQVAKTLLELTEALKTARRQKPLIGFVPTMGNLHQGHLALVEEAKRQTDFVVASIFVNPTQFGPNEDFNAYPRTLDQDLQYLAKLHVNLVFTPTVTAMYPADSMTQIEVQGLSDLHCGAFRPGHFIGVTTVVCKLLNLIQPQHAFFGKKDYQQWRIIQRMVVDLNMSVSIHGCPTLREPDGLAMSSRNSYLSPTERQTAPQLYQQLLKTAQAIGEGVATFTELENTAIASLQRQGFNPDYLAICNSYTLLPAKQADRHIVVLTAARLGKTRLIDNVELTLPNRCSA